MARIDRARAGSAIYFPNSVEYVGTFGEWMVNYPSSIGRFATASLWDDYPDLPLHGRALEAGNADMAVLTPAGVHADRFLGGGGGIRAGGGC